MNERSINTVLPLFLFQLALFTSLLLAFVVQIQVIFPLERTFVPEQIVELVSLLYLPFGLKVIFATLTGGLAVVPIFLSHAVADIYFGKGMEEAFLNASLGVIVVFLPIMVLNFVGERPLMVKLDLSKSNINLFRSILALAFSASVLNAFFQTLRFQGLNIDLLAFRYVVGDLGGTVVVLLVLFLAKQPILRFMHDLMKKAE